MQHEDYLPPSCSISSSGRLYRRIGDGNENRFKITILTNVRCADRGALFVKVPWFRLKLLADACACWWGKDARACSTADRRRIGHLAPDSKAWHHVPCHTHHPNLEPPFNRNRACTVHWKPGTVDKWTQAGDQRVDLIGLYLERCTLPFKARQRGAVLAIRISCGAQAGRSLTLEWDAAAQAPFRPD